MVRRKNSVAALSPPERMPRTSSTLMARMASPKIFAAWGAAASAARFMLSTKSSTCFWAPALRATSATRWMSLGMRIFTASLAK